jgi:hypothetical protein
MDLHTPCRKPLKQLSPFAQVLQPRDNSSDSKIYGILKRLSHEVSGNGYECSMEKYSIRTHMGFFMGISQLYKIEPIPISINECWKMVRIKKCTNHDMVCDGQSCFYRASLQPTYQWLTSLTFEDYSCHSTRRVISAKKLNDTLFNSIFPNCKAADLFCQLSDHIIVWQRDVLHSCPYELITSSQMHLTATDILKSTQDNLLFQLTSVETACGIPVILTHEGLYVTHISYTDGLRQSEKTLKDIQDLSLSDAYYNIGKSIELIMNLQSIFCHQAISTIKLLSKFHDEFLKIYDKQNNPIILYAKHHNVYVPPCVLISEITILSNTSNCYEHIPIQFQYNNLTVNGFLKGNNILA